MRRVLTVALAFLWALAFPALAVADSYAYYAPITVTESSGSARTAMPVRLAINNTYLSSNGYISTTGLNTSFTTVTPSRWIVADDKLVFYVPSLQANGTNSYQYNLGVSPAQTATAIVLGVGGYIQTSDAAPLEPTNQGFQFGAQGYLNTTNGAGKCIVSKTDAIDFCVSGAGTMRARIFSQTTLGPANSSTSDGQVSSTNVVYNTAWTAATGTVDNVSTSFFIGQNTGYVIYRSALYFDTSSIPVGATIESATLNLYVASDNTTTDFVVTVQNGQPTYPHDPLVAGDYDKTNYSGAGSTFNTSGIVAGAYNAIPLNAAGMGYINKGGATKLMVRSDRDIAGTTPTNAENIEVQSAEGANPPTLTVTYATPVSITAAVASGIHNTRLTYDNVTFKMFIDDLVTPAASQATTISVENNANAWNFMQGDINPYLDFIVWTVNGVDVLYYQPNTIISGTTLPDRDIGDGAQDGSISWGTNPAGITASVGAIVPTTTTAPSSVTAPQPSLVSPTKLQTLRCDAGSAASGAGLTNCTPVALSTLPFYGLFLAMSNATAFGGATAIPVLWFYVVMTIPFTMGLPFGAYLLFRSAPTTGKIVAVAVCGLLIGIFTVMQIYPFWMIIVWLPGAVAFVLFDKVWTIS